MGMLTVAGIWSLFVALTLWLPLWGGAPGFAVYVVTMACNEIPLVLLAVFGASMVTVGVGDEGPAGASVIPATTVLALVVTLGLTWLQVRARRAGPALESDLSTQLGAHRRAPGPEVAHGAGKAAAWRDGILRPFQRHPRSVTRDRNLSYGPDRAHRLDVYRRRNAGAGARPVLIHLHGGGFVQGRRSRESVALLNQLADHGWFCVSADYWLRSRGAFPQSLIDVKRVIGWVRAHAQDNGTDPDQVFLLGASAGGHLAVSAALTADAPRFQPGFEGIDTHVAGAVSVYGYLGARGPDPDSSPTTLARPDAPPLLIVQGARDTAIASAGPREVSAHLRSVSRSPVVHAELPNTQHGFDLFASVRARIVAGAIEQFLDWARSTPNEADTAG